MSAYPVPIEQFHNTLMRLKGMVSVESGIENLEPIEADMLGYSACAHLPHAALLRTGGGLENEVLLQFELVLEYSLESLQSVEFLAWFARDSARGGTKLQLRPFALPPETPYGRQLGTSLKWHMELFVDGIEDTLEPAFETVSRLHQSLQTAIQLYQIPVK